MVQHHGDPALLSWDEERGVGYYPCEPDGVYDAAYFKRFAEYHGSRIDIDLRRFRTELVHRYAGEHCQLLDIGACTGSFVLGWTGWKGCDINPVSRAFLDAQGVLGDYHDRRWEVLTFWDSLEHFHDPTVPLRSAETWAFVSLPIFHDLAHALRSKHFRPREHYWYWTRGGFCRFAAAQGFTVVDILATETVIGREDIETFVLLRDPGNQSP